MRSGDVSLSDGFLIRMGLDSYLWSATTINHIWGSPGLGAYRLYFSGSITVSSNGPVDRWAGFPVRCLASGA